MKKIKNMKILPILLTILLFYSLPAQSVEIEIHVVIDSNLITSSRDRLFDKLLPKTTLLSESRDTGADYIIFLTDIISGCGRANNVNRSLSQVNSRNNNLAFSDPNCGADTFVHELGHLMGLAHGEQVVQATGISGHRNGITNYSKGWGRIVSQTSLSTGNIAADSADEAVDAGEFGTIMVGNHIQNWTRFTRASIQPPLFSSPTNRHPACRSDLNRDGRITSADGVDASCGNTANGDAVRTLNEFRFDYSRINERRISALASKFPDDNFYRCLLNKYRNSKPSSIRTIDCPSQDIKNLQGIEVFSSLISIDLSDNRIVNLSALENIGKARVNHINLSGNDGVLCHQLKATEENFPRRVIVPQRCFNIGAAASVL